MIYYNYHVHIYIVIKISYECLLLELEEAVKKAREEEIKIPFGIGVAGVVAQSKTVINIRDAYTVSRICS